MSKITLILGGARSGKSSFGLTLAKKYGKKIAFIATCAPLDREMKERVGLHKLSRPKTWSTFEEPEKLEQAISQASKGHDFIIIECLTFWVSNLLLLKRKEKEVLDRAINVLDICKSSKAGYVFVANEVGLGLVPANKLGRKFRDAAGRINQLFAQEADDVYFMTAGLPMTVKKNGKIKTNY